METKSTLSVLYLCFYLFIYFITALSSSKENYKHVRKNFHNLILLECKLQNKFDENVKNSNMNRNMKNLIFLPF